MNGRQQLHRFSGLLDLNRLSSDDHPPRPAPYSPYPPHPIHFLHGQRRRSWTKPSLLRQTRQTRSESISGPSVEYEVDRARSLDAELLRGRKRRSSAGDEAMVSCPESAPPYSHSSSGSICEGNEDEKGEEEEEEDEAAASSRPTRRQESVTYEESIPVIVRRRGCMLTVRIVSVDDIEEPAREPKLKSATAPAPPQPPKSLSTLSLPQVSRPFFFPS